MAVKYHNRILKRMLETLGSYTLQAMLLDGYTDDPDDNFVADLVADEITNVGYSRPTLANVTVTQDDANNRAKITCDALDFGLAVGAVTTTKLAIYRFVTNDADSEVVAVFDCAISLPAGGSLGATIGANGLALFTG